MFLVRDQRRNYLVFMHHDPRHEGFDMPVEVDADVVVPDNVNDWPYGHERPQTVVGVADGGKTYHVFRNDQARRDASFAKAGTKYAITVTWQDYDRVWHAFA